MDIKTSSREENHRVVVTLNSHPNFAVDIRYEPEKNALRVIQGGSRRLFFYEADTFFPSRGVLMNEYGMVVAKLQWRSAARGLIQLDDTRVNIVDEPAQGWVELHLQGMPGPVFWHYQSAAAAVDIHNNPRLFRSLLLVLAWSVGVAALQHH